MVDARRVVAAGRAGARTLPLRAPPGRGPGVEALAPGGRRSRAGVDRHEVGGERLEARLAREREAGDADVPAAVREVARPAAADAAAVEDRDPAEPLERGLVRVADE